MIYQVKIGETVLFTGNMIETVNFISNYKRYNIEWLVVHGYDWGEQERQIPHEEPAKSIIK